jgi:arabinose-5-phosphate isomerase
MVDPEKCPVERLNWCSPAQGDAAMDCLATAREVLDIEIEGLEAVRDALGQGFAAAVTCLLGCQGRIITTGIGKSGLVAKKLASTFSSIGAASAFLHPVEAAHGDLGLVRPVDVVLALSNSGETREVLAIMPEFTRIGCQTIGLTSSLDSSLAQQVDFPVLVRVPREACILNLIPTASTTAAMAVGDAFATCLVRARKVTVDDFYHCHPGGALGRRLSERVSQVMAACAMPMVGRDHPLLEAVEVLDRGGVGTLVVVDDAGRVLGVITDGDIRRALVRGRLDLSRPVETIMTVNPLTIPQTSYLEEAIDLMEQRGITSLPVVDGAGMLVGILHIHDILGKGAIRFSQAAPA